MKTAARDKAQRPYSLARVLLVSGLYAAFALGAVYLTYKLLLEPARERERPAIPKRTEVSPDPLLTLITAAHLRATGG
jgi:hypothetical protein